MPIDVKALIESDDEEARCPCCVSLAWQVTAHCRHMLQDQRPLKVARRDDGSGIRGALPAPKHSAIFEPKVGAAVLLAAGVCCCC